MKILPSAQPKSSVSTNVFLLDVFYLSEFLVIEEQCCLFYCELVICDEKNIFDIRVRLDSLRSTVEKAVDKIRAIATNIFEQH